MSIRPDAMGRPWRWISTWSLRESLHQLGTGSGERGAAPRPTGWGRLYKVFSFSLVGGCPCRTALGKFMGGGRVTGGHPASLACCGVPAPVLRATCCDGVRERQHAGRTRSPAASGLRSELVGADRQHRAGGVEQDPLDGASEDELSHHGPVPKADHDHVDVAVLGDLDDSIPGIRQDRGLDGQAQAGLGQPGFQPAHFLRLQVVVAAADIHNQQVRLPEVRFLDSF